MSMKPMKPIAKPKQQVQVDLTQADTMACQKCENKIFIQGYIIKKISAILSPTGKEVVAPIQVFNCGSCGELLPMGGELDELI
jgi:DNA-directed RNA polymerase subunit RPC12/RpoP|tara:strand:- start:1097 stop:1345 length:249 start_codon:yes stop_codon:yes gene_type:complete